MDFFHFLGHFLIGMLPLCIDIVEINLEKNYVPFDGDRLAASLPGTLKVTAHHITVKKRFLADCLGQVDESFMEFHKLE